MTLRQKTTTVFSPSFISRSLLAGSLLFSANAMAQNVPVQQKVPACDYDTPVCVEAPSRSAKPACETLYEGRGMCLSDTVAESLLGAVESKEGYCLGPATQRCYDTTLIPNLAAAVEQNSIAILDLKGKHQALENTVTNLINSTEQLHTVMGRALEPELRHLETLQGLYETLCQPASTNENCLPAWIAYQNAVNYLANRIRQNLLAVPEEQRLNVEPLIDAALSNYFMEDFARTRQMIDENAIKLSFMPTLSYQFSALNAESDLDTYHAFAPGVEACLYTPSEFFGFCLTGNVLVGNAADRGLGVEKNYHFTLPTVTNTQDHGDYSDINTVTTDEDVARITYGSIGAAAKVGLVRHDTVKLSLLASVSLELGREYRTTIEQGTSVLSFQGVPEAPRIITDVTNDDSLFVNVVPQVGAEFCYDAGISRSCAYSKIGPNFPTGNDEGVTLTGSLGLGTGLHF